MQPILIVGFPAIGDFIRGHSAVQIIADAYPGRPIDVVCSAAAQPVARLMPHVRKSWTLRKEAGRLGFSERSRLARQLRDENYGTAFVLPSDAKSALVPMLARIPERIGYPRELQFGMINRFPADWLRQFLALGSRRPRMYEQICAVATLGATPVPAEGWPQPRLLIDAAELDDWRASRGIDPGRPALAIYTSGMRDVRSWPIERFVAIARDYTKRGWAIWILGSWRERSATARILAELPEAVDFTATPRLDEAICQIAASTIFLGVDGGLSHAAAALGVPCVLIFGSNLSHPGGPVNRHVRFVEPPIGVPETIGGTRGVSEDRVREALQDVGARVAPVHV